MKKIISISLSFLLIVILLGENINAKAQTTFSQGYSRVYNVVYSGLVANSCINDINNYFESELNFIPDGIDMNEYDDEWIDDAISFMDNDMNISQNSSNVYNEEVAKAASIAYSMECANWSINNGRGTDFTDECMYMFISHYIDRADYYWSNQNYSYLNDGPSMSENTSYFAKWIVDDDRLVYDNYMNNNYVIGSVNSVKGLYDEVTALYDGTKSDVDVTAAFNRASNAAQNLYALSQTYLISDALVDDFAGSISYVVDTVAANDAQSSLEYMYDQFIDDDGLFHISDVTVRKQFVDNTVSLIANMIIAEVTGGGSLVSDVVSSFQYDTYMNLFNLAAYVNMRSSFHGREAQRYYDFLIYRYL